MIEEVNGFATAGLIILGFWGVVFAILGACFYWGVRFAKLVVVRVFKRN